jgi:hypothetical protein
VHDGETATTCRADFHERGIFEFPDDARANLACMSQSAG